MTPSSPAIPAASPVPFTITPATLRDLFAARALERACFGPDAWGYFEMFASLLFPGNTRLKAITDEEMVGLAIGEERRHEHSAWIATIAVHPSHQRRGIGRALLSACEAATRQPIIKLSVRASNQPAIALYKQFGYQRVNVWSGYYSGGEDGIVMEKHRAQ
ncbi:MAG: GNAT family N-acetyltransferase [Chloroflexi bacterium]|nr:GNAT family N-acetyltransferase [Chloroflexota bacterium]